MEKALRSALWEIPRCDSMPCKALEIFDGIYDIESVRMTIFQPRKGNISTDFIEKDALLEWADGELSEKAKLAYDGQGEFHCGEWS